jgi:hypothetical protein
MILGALSAAGGQKYLEQQAKANPVAFMTLVGKVLPLQVAGSESAPIQLNVIPALRRRRLLASYGALMTRPTRANPCAAQATQHNSVR